ncbi:MAG: hypothetical protein JST16_12630 [Bdellovibrionales bacterium]|nr:hypothetical protein [Bdellovibrionales bacterium]
MALVTSNLVLAGVLLVSPSHPALIQRPGLTVWLSQPKIIEAQAVGRNISLRVRSPGLIHASGLDSTRPDLTRVQSVSDATYQAAQRCPRASIDWTANPPQANSSSPAELQKLASCGFEALALPESLQQNDQRFIEAETKLLRAGFRILASSTVGARRSLRVGGSAQHLESRLRQALGEMRPFYDVQFVEGPAPGRTLVFEVSLFEFSRAKAASLGVRWPGSVALKSAEGGGPAVTGAGGTPLEIGADFGESLGLARVLARPQIRTKPGEKASFQSGGEIPIRSSTPYATSTQWKNYGLILTLEPDANVETGAGEITLNFKLELSEPDPATAIDGVPGMKLRRLESRFDLRVSETTILTTLIQTRSGTVQSGLPGFKDVSFLSSLFGHRDRSESDSELWFAIRPSWEDIRVR